MSVCEIMGWVYKVCFASFLVLSLFSAARYEGSASDAFSEAVMINFDRVHLRPVRVEKENPEDSIRIFYVLGQKCVFLCDVACQYAHDGESVFLRYLREPQKWFVGKEAYKDVLEEIVSVVVCETIPKDKRGRFLQFSDRYVQETKSRLFAKETRSGKSAVANPQKVLCDRKFQMQAGATLFPCRDLTWIGMWGDEDVVTLSELRERNDVLIQLCDHCVVHPCAPKKDALVLLFLDFLSNSVSLPWGLLCDIVFALIPSAENSNIFF